MADHSRLDILIDVFDMAKQHARPLASLTAQELISATLDEFRELAYLSNDPTKYQLLDASDGDPLHDGMPLSDQIGGDAHLLLVDREPEMLPSGTKQVTQDVYLRETQSGAVYKLHWSPSIIGRSDKNVEHEEWLLSNFETLPRGLRISRRHAQISERNGRFYIKQLSRNPTLHDIGDGVAVSLEDSERELGHGDHIKLERSGTEFKFIIRNKISEQIHE